MNVLFIIADQHLATCMGHEGHPQAITPNLDRLAGQGMRFRQAYTQNPICTPSRTSMLSGQYCHNHGYYGLSGPRPVSLPSLFSHFHSRGHKTAAIGNIHTPDFPRNWLEGHLDLFLDYFAAVDGQHWKTPFYENLRAQGLIEKEDVWFFHYNPAYALEGFPSKLTFEQSQEGWSVDQAIRFMRACEGKPFCMQVSLQRPHQPFTPDQRFWDIYPADLALPPTLNQDPSGRPPHFRAMYDYARKMKWPIKPDDFESGMRRLWRGYLACITHVDHAVGQLLDHLDRAKLAEDTIVIYTADHGAYSGTHGIPEKAPGICSDAVCRVPLICRVPGVTNRKPGAVSNHLVELVDLTPTFASLCNLPPMQTVDGKDISPILRDGDRATAVHDVAVTENVWSKAIRWKQWRFVHYPRQMFAGQDVGELYDIASDPNETKNLYADPAHQNIVTELRRLLTDWLISTTRAKTIWPAPGDDATKYPTAEDGHESNTAGAAERARSGMLNYL